MGRLFKCTACGQYTLEEKTCPKCGEPVVTPHPPRFSPQDRYGKYRRQAKRRARVSSQRPEA